MNPGWHLLFKDMQLTPGRVLRRAGLAENLFNRLPVTLSSEEYFRFFDAMDAESGKDELPIILAEAISGEIFSPPLFSAICSANLIDGARRIARYKALTGAFRIETDESEEEFTIRLTWPLLLEPPLSLVLSELLFWVGLMRMCCRCDVKATRVLAPSLPSNRKNYKEFAGASVKRSDKAAIAFNIDDARRAFLTRNDQIWESFEPALRQRLTTLDANATMSEQVRAILLEAIPAGETSMDVIAHKLRFSTRTLQRRLQSESTSFQDILADTRNALAHHYLTRTTIPIIEIAFLLGYDDPNSFYRAFKARNDKTPEQVRTQQKEH